MSTYAPADSPLFDGRPASDTTHVLMPWMRYACGRGVVEDGGHFIVGPSQGWERVDCPDCRGFGRDELAEACRLSQREQAGAA